jgi:hypothetical protein
MIKIEILAIRVKVIDKMYVDNLLFNHVCKS